MPYLIGTEQSENGYQCAREFSKLVLKWYQSGSEALQILQKNVHH